jgi:hypothetical protein
MMLKINDSRHKLLKYIESSGLFQLNPIVELQRIQNQNDNIEYFLTQSDSSDWLTKIRRCL